MNIYQLESPIHLQEHLTKYFEMYSFINDWSSDEAIRKQHIPTSSPKHLFFAEKENLFRFDGTVFRETIPTPDPFALYGVSSCDLTAIAYQDQFFKDDPYYQARRNQALLVGLDCIEPCEHGFCYEVNAGPGVDQECADLILHPLYNNQWLLMVVNDKGENAIKGFNLPPADITELRQREENLDYCEQQFSDYRYLHEGVEAINQQNIPETLWDQLGLQCLTCSGCTTLCPTCSCYGTREVHTEDNQFQQQRFWDSCLYDGFQREASQHNPSLQPGTRVERFWKHKFDQKFVDDFGRYGCVGCGRCEQTCPGVVGVHSVMKKVAPYAQSHTH